MNGTLADFARHIGVNKSSVTRAVQQGRIQREPDGSIDFGKALAAWGANSGGRGDVAARHAAKRGAAIPAHRSAEESATAGLESQIAGIELPTVEQTGRQRAQATRMHYENQQLKLEFALRRGLRCELAAVKREGQAIGAMLRAGIERVIDQTAPRLAAAGNALERRRIVETELRRLRWMVKRELPRALRRMKEAGAAAKVGAGGTVSE